MLRAKHNSNAGKHRQRGFSLIELLIVVAIILIIAAIAIPNLLRARMAANQASGASTIRTINSATMFILRRTIMACPRVSGQWVASA